jgi:hypothetical protein
VRLQIAISSVLVILAFSSVLRAEEASDRIEAPAASTFQWSFPLGKSFDVFPGREGLKNCISGEREVLVTPGDGVRAELTPLQTPAELLELLGLNGFSPFAKEKNISETKLASVDWFSNISRIFVIKVIRDEGIFALEDQAFNSESIADQTPPTDNATRSQWAKQLCGSHVVSKYRKQAWEAWVFKASFLPGRQRRLVEAAFGLLDYTQQVDYLQCGRKQSYRQPPQKLQAGCRLATGRVLGRSPRSRPARCGTNFPWGQ